MATIRFFRDNLTLDSTLLGRLLNAGVTPNGGDTLVLGAANCTLISLSPDFNYVILADALVASSFTIALTAIGVPAPAISVFANSIVSTLDVKVAGVAGDDGEPGAKGDDGDIVSEPPGKPVRLPGSSGEPGEHGGDGGQGGSITIRYASAPIAPTASAPGGPGGKGGAGGAGGAGKPPGKRGANGKPGRSGPPGSVSIIQVPAGQVFQGLELDTLAGWAEYRTDVGEYFFRLFDPNSQLHALAE